MIKGVSLQKGLPRRIRPNSNQSFQESRHTERHSQTAHMGKLLFYMMESSLGSGLENRRGCKPTVGSNPTPSARINGLERMAPNAYSAKYAPKNGPSRHKSRHSKTEEK